METPQYHRLMIRDVPGKLERPKLVKTYKGGGTEFEQDILPKMRGIKLDQPSSYTEPTKSKVSKEVKWIYVGNHWWCRKNSRKYEFGRMMAVEFIKNKGKNICGVWDSRIHDRKEKSKKIYLKGTEKSGNLLSYSKYEVWVNWGNRMVQSFKNKEELDRLEFEDKELFRKLKKILKQ